MPEPKFEFKYKTPPPDYDRTTSYGGIPQGFAPGEFEFTTKFGQDNYKLRAQQQRWYEQAGLTLANLIPNIATGIVEGFAYIPELWDGDKDYSNAVTRTMQQWKNPFGEVYRENPNETFDLSDPAWWFTNAGQLVESIGAFATEAGILARAFGGIANAAAKAMGGTARMLQAGQRTAQTITASTLAYTEGAMSGARIYDDVFNKEFKRLTGQGIDPADAIEEAKTKASNAAATTVKMNTIMNTVMNMGVISPLFHKPSDKVLDWWKTKGKQQAGESFSAYQARLKAISSADEEVKMLLKNRSMWNSWLPESFKEGLEEVNTQYAEAEGRRVGEGKGQGLGQALLNVNQYISDVTNEEGALNFVLGMFGGAGTTLAIDYIPKYVEKVDGDGNILYKKAAEGKAPVAEKQLISTRTYNTRGRKEFFDNIQKVILSDAARLEDLHKQLLTATEQGNKVEIEKIRHQIFAAGALDAVSKGLTDNWKEQFNQIAALDNEQDLGEAMQEEIDELQQQLIQAEDKTELQQQLTEKLKQQEQLKGKTEAILKGYASVKGDQDYKERARNTVEDLTQLGEIHKQTQKQLEGIPDSGELADHLYFLKSDLYLRNRAIEREEKRLAKEQAYQYVSADVYNAAVQKYKEQQDVWTEAANALNRDITRLRKADAAASVKDIEDLIEQYRIPGIEDADLQENISKLIKKLELKKKLLETSAETARATLESQSGYQAWKQLNPNDTFQQYRDIISEDSLRKQELSHLEVAKAQRDVAAENLEELQSKGNISKMLEKFHKERKKMKEQMEKHHKKVDAEAQLLEQNKKAAASIPLQQRKTMYAKLKQELAELTVKLNTLRQKETELSLQIKEQQKRGLLSSFNNVMKLKNERSLIRAQIRSVEAQMQYLKERMNRLLPDIQYQQEVSNTASVQTAEDISKEERPVDEDSLPATQRPVVEEATGEVVAQAPASSEALTPDQIAEQAIDEYLTFVQQLPQPVQDMLTELERYFTENEYENPYSFTMLNRNLTPFIRKKMITQSQINEVGILMRKMLEAVTEPVPETQELPVDPLTEEEQADAIDPVSVTEVQESEQPEIVNNSEKFSDEAISESYWEDRALSTTAVKAASNDVKYKTIKAGGTLKIRPVTVQENDVYVPQLDDNTNTDRMIPGKIQEGDTVILQIDSEWKGGVQNHHFLELSETGENVLLPDSFSGYTDENGKIRTDDAFMHQGYANVPVKIIHAKTGKVIGYLPMNSWINQTGGAQTYRNLPPDVVARENAINLKIRKKLAEEWNKNSSHSMSTTVAARTPGHLMYSEYTDDSGQRKFTVHAADYMLPGNVPLAVVTKEGVLTGKKSPSEYPLNLPADEQRQASLLTNMRGSPVALLQMPNGLYEMAPLRTERLNRKSDITTVAKVITLHLRQGTKYFTEKEQKMVDEIEAVSGFDILTGEGLKNFIEQYFFRTTKFYDEATTAIEGTGAVVQRWMLGISDKRLKTIKAGTRFSGQPPVYAKLVQGNLHAEFMKQLEQHIPSMFRSVNFTDGGIRGINSSGKFSTIRITEDDKINVTEYKNYNDYVKSISATAVYGRHQVGGRYVYGVNSQVELDMNPLMDDLSTVLLASETPDPEQENADPVSDILDLLGQNEMRMQKAIMPEGLPVTIGNLQEMSNFTPAAEHNGKSVQEVFDYLKGLSIAAIAPGYNPFTKCS